MIFSRRVIIYEVDISVLEAAVGAENEQLPVLSLLLELAARCIDRRHFMRIMYIPELGGARAKEKYKKKY